ncbi:DNA gyrase inhibitor YacG [Pseudoblastomonas halimionae]|uniref:DNA gyrase inhibitor YacG n=1 Tax=Alteriqipengyuania halimionae TaxID=1926630 RepID=A0A6I4U1D7_9SPHN|nr:DNA gyrase inhibitor YacG [Alteriqipengyuania halimionae]MXP09879.1 DNA gyrase inhibitor YacG [Alteriqipengyuania halimionae]
MSTSTQAPSRPRARPCPICKKPRSEEFAPFCSKRCRDRDLGAWLTDSYAVPGQPVDPATIAHEESDD